MSSPYVTLGNKPLEQWKVTELKEELKRRKLITKGLKEDLLKRLDEAVRIELQAEAEDADNGATDATQSEVPIEQETMKSFVSGKSKDVMDKGIGVDEKVDSKTGIEIDDHRRSLVEGKLVETDLVQASGLEGEQIAQFASVETTVVVSTTAESVTASSGSHLQGRLYGQSSPVPDDDRLKLSKEDTKLGPSDPSTQFPPTNESIMPVLPPSEPSLQGNEAQKEAMNSTVPLKNDDSESLLPDHNAEPLKYQVSEVDPNLGFQVISDSISTESVSIIEKNEKKVDVITDNVKIELDVKHEMGQTSLSSVVPDGGESHPMDVDQPLDKKDTDQPLGKIDDELLFGKKEKFETTDRRDVEEPVDKKVSVEETAVSNAEIAESLKNIDSGDLDPPEKLSLDRSSGDDSMEEDVMESKQVEYKSSSDKIEGNVEKSESPIGKEDVHVDVVGLDKPIETKITSGENESLPVLTSVKRKFNDKVAVVNDDIVKRVRRWNTEGSKGSEPQSSSVVASSMPKNISQSTARRLSGTDSAEEAPKERVVPPSSKPPTNSLRIDRFLRPFTLKAVQELLGKTGTVTSFWMDQIKTHCYVSYSSVEEAVETRNAVYNLQWPANGGRTLVAEFVDPQEVKTRVEAPPASPATPAAAQNQSTVPPQPSPRQLALSKQQLPPPPPPPPLANPPALRDRLQPPAREQQPLPARERLNLPPPPLPLAEKVEQPIVTLDDLFRKTKATPRIYYLPLSDEEVAAKLKAQGKNNVN